MPGRLWILLLTAALLAGCLVSFESAEPGAFSCEDDADCITPNRCVNGVCTLDGDTCTDADGDGYGVGDTSDCPRCIEADQCAEDCDDGDDSVHPGLTDTCDGKDNNCNDEIDEPTSCETSTDCPSEPGDSLPFCENDTCVYKPAIQPMGAAECREPLACVDGMREEPPEACQ